MQEINNFLEYLQIYKKHSNNTINSYQIDILEFYKFNHSKININKEVVNNYLSYLYENNLNGWEIQKRLHTPLETCRFCTHDVSFDWNISHSPFSKDDWCV